MAGTVFKPNRVKSKLAAAAAAAAADAADADASDATSDAIVTGASTTPVTGPSNRQLGNVSASTSTAGTSNIVDQASTSSTLSRKTSTGPPAATKTKFVPNRRRSGKVIDDDGDSDVKMEDISSSYIAHADSSAPGRGRGRGRGRGAAAPRGRVEVQMTASGPLAQGPRALPTSRKAGGASSGGSGAPGQYADAHDLDSDLDDAQSDDDLVIRAQDLNTIGDEDEMAPLNLPRDPKVLRLANQRREQRHEAKQRAEERLKEQIFIKPEPEDGDSIMLSTTATPAPVVSTFDDVVIEEHEEKKNFVPSEEVDLTEDFDTQDPGREQLYMFQFPRRFPHFVPVTDSQAQQTKAKNVKKEHAEDRKQTSNDPPLEWGKAGERKSKAARWQAESGQIGQLRIHQSGRVTMKIRGDMTFEVLPAATPTFLQEVVIIDHDPSLVPSTTDSEHAAPSPNGALFTMGQTNKKFIVVPAVSRLLEAVEQEERDAKAARIAMKAAALKAKNEVH